mmetsp:Transcript_22544/g.62551  ORF Transcript_22544/g.62551 Transcript_22544/m.62551 type:complete len:397 (-) Transcript_22544:48-1238(-)
MGLPVAISAAVALAACIAKILTAPPEAPTAGACRRLEGHLQHELVGQGPAFEAAVDAVCAHLADKQARHPLLISVHGPPGVGKTLFHKLLAESLYNLTDGLHACPGQDCPAYKILLGMDYSAAEAADQFSSLQKSILLHLRRYPSALLVVEEFDKAPCAARELIRQLVTHGNDSVQAKIQRSIIILESNTGYLELYDLLRQAGWDRAKVDPDAVSSVMKDVVFSLGTTQQCSTSVHSNRLVNSISEFLAFYPLDYQHIMQAAGLELVHWANKLTLEEAPVGELRPGDASLLHEMKRAGLRMAQWAKDLAAHGVHVHMEWDDAVIQFLASKVYFDEDGFSIDGASGLRMIVSKFVSKAVRKWELSLEAQAPAPVRCSHRLQLRVTPAGNQLEISELP